MKPVRLDLVAFGPYAHRQVIAPVHDARRVLRLEQQQHRGRRVPRRGVEPEVWDLAQPPRDVLQRPGRERAGAVRSTQRTPG